MSFIDLLFKLILPAAKKEGVDPASVARSLRRKRDEIRKMETELLMDMEKDGIELPESFYEGISRPKPDIHPSHEHSLVLPYKKPLPLSSIQRLFNRPPIDNAYIEINNFISLNGIRSFDSDTMFDILYKYKINKPEKQKLCRIYEDYLLFCLEDHFLTEKEISELNYLKTVFALTDSDVASINTRIGRDVYEEEFQKAIGDGHIRAIKREFLRKLSDDLQLNPKIVKDIEQSSATTFIKRFVDSKLQSKMLSPSDETQFLELSKNLGVKVQFDESTVAQMEKYRFFWKVENGTFPNIRVHINLPHSEQCYFTTHAEWFEYRKQSKKLNYAGPTLNLKIMKGLYWRMGSLNVKRISEDVMTMIDVGTLYLTNKRIIFVGIKTNKSIPLKAILDFKVFENGIDIRKSAGRTPFIMVYQDADVLAFLLGKAISLLK